MKRLCWPSVLLSVSALQENIRMPLSSLRTASQLRTRDLFKDPCAAWARGQASERAARRTCSSGRGSGFRLITFHEKNNELQKQASRGKHIRGHSGAWLPRASGRRSWGEAGGGAEQSPGSPQPGAVPACSPSAWGPDPCPGTACPLWSLGHSPRWGAGGQCVWEPGPGSLGGPEHS